MRKRAPMIVRKICAVCLLRQYRLLVFARLYRHFHACCGSHFNGEVRNRKSRERVARGERFLSLRFFSFFFLYTCPFILPHLARYWLFRKHVFFTYNVNVWPLISARSLTAGGNRALVVALSRKISQDCSRVSSATLGPK